MVGDGDGVGNHGVIIISIFCTIQNCYVGPSGLYAVYMVHMGLVHIYGLLHCSCSIKTV